VRLPCIGKLEDASEDRGSSFGVVTASMSCKNFLFLYGILLLQVVLISKSMGIKAPAANLLCIQNKQNNTYLIPKNKKSIVSTINKNNQRIKENKMN